MARTLRTEVAVIGGGLIGCWTALFLRRRGRAVAVLEQGEIGARSSGVNFGNLRLQGRHRAQFPLALRAAALWEQVDALIGDACAFASTGHLYVACDTAQAERLAAQAGEAAAGGLEVALLDGAELRRRWPWLSDRVVAGSWSARDATANPRLVTPATARAAQALGADILAATQVREVGHANGRFRLLTEGGLTVESDWLVNAAGAWGADIAARFDEPVPMFAAGPPQFATAPVPVFISPSVQAVDGSVIFRQVARGNVIAAGYPRTAADLLHNHAPVPPAKTLTTMRRLVELVPSLVSAAVIRVWSGVEGYLPDMLPVLGPGATPGLLHAFGFCGHGFQLGPGVGLVLSELIADGATPTPLGAFAIGRFAAGVEADAKLAREFDAAAVARADGG